MIMALIPHSFANNIAEMCVKKFCSLPKTGKPERNKHWTAMSAFVKESSCGGTVSMFITFMTCFVV